MTISNIIDFLFGSALLINAGLIIAQLMKIVSHKSARDVSLVTFAGFGLIQLVTLSYGYMHSASILFYGTMFSLIASLGVVVAIIYYKLLDKKDSCEIHHLSEPSLSQIIALVPANVYWLNRDGIFLGCNNNMLRILGLKSIDEYRGKTYEDLYEQNHIRTIKETDKKVMEMNTAISLEEIAVPNRVYLTHKIPLHDAKGQVVGLLGVSIDITERKNVEKALQHEKIKSGVAMAKTEFLLNMRHEIRTPLANVIGLGKVLQEQEKPFSQKDLLDDMVISSESLMGLLNEFLEFSSIEEGLLPIRSVRFSPEEVMREINSIVRASAINKGLNYAVHINADMVPSRIIGDKMRLHRVILNLVSNAVKYTHAGSVVVRIDVASETERKIYLKITVEDTGIGIPSDKIDFIFGRFNKLNGSYHGDQGTGLGLSIAKQFIHDLDGEIYVESEENKETKFTCILPFFKPFSITESGEGDSAKTTLKLRYDSHKVLLVEDDKIAQKLACFMLSKNNCVVEVADSGKEAQEYFRKSEYDFIRHWFARYGWVFPCFMD